jgi:hypothetical protein
MTTIHPAAGGPSSLGGVASTANLKSTSDLYFDAQTARIALLEKEVSKATLDIQSNLQKITSLRDIRTSLTTQKTYFTDSESGNARLIDQNPYAEQFKHASDKQVEGYRRASDPADPSYDPNYLARAAGGEFGEAYQSLAKVATDARSAGQSDSIVRSYALGTITSAGIDATVTDVQGKIDSLMSTQQLQMFTLQSCMDKRSEALDSASNFLKKNSDTENSVVSNIR